MDRTLNILHASLNCILPLSQNKCSFRIQNLSKINVVLTFQYNSLSFSAPFCFMCTFYFFIPSQFSCPTSKTTFILGQSTFQANCLSIAILADGQPVHVDIFGLCLPAKIPRYSKVTVVPVQQLYKSSYMIMEKLPELYAA